jgi:hypothetical protein
MCAGAAAAESTQDISDPANRTGLRALLCGLLMLAATLAAGAADPVAGAQPHPGWAKLVTVTAHNEEERVLQAVFQEVTRQGVPDTYAAGVVSALNRHIDGDTAAGRTVTICFGMLIDATTAAYRAKWSADETGRLLVFLQVELDAAHRPTVARLRETVTQVGNGAKPEEILAGPHAAQAGRH